MNAEELKQLKEQALEETAEAGSNEALEAVRIRYLGRKGVLQEVMKGLKDQPPQDRPLIGQLANELKQELQAALTDKTAALEGATEGPETLFDYTLPGDWHSMGTRHPLSKITERAVAIFRSLGFTVAEGPDVETVYNNFDALNTPPAHPSRDMQDTFYLDNGDLLRCHTSPVQVRYMQKHRPPVRIIAPGRCYRRDTPDATHSANFHQIEGLYVDEQVSMADLKGTLSYFAGEMMGPGVKIRFRPHFFPFTEPSVECDFSCHVCGGAGCRVCKQSGWIEILGAGMVDPNVFRAVGYDPERITGYAFGMGIERIAMILYGIHDIRMLYENDVRFLKQF
ncbi:MAG: phenylalanine--tRNA ligase subunit alpha [Kiritimatiellae bacterium]|nr:phenylalanine--tRNA ligase subunit alpha [Kiritimatiellia bacterium]